MDGSSRYQLLGRISRGGMAEVLLARDLASPGAARYVAVKRVLAQRVERDQLTRTLEREAAVMRRLRHPNLVRIEDFVVLEGESYLVMEAVDGLSCAELLDHTDRVPAPVVSRILAEASAALTVAHTLPGADGGDGLVIHRDISPDNLLLSWDGHVKVTDFGIALALDVTRTTEQGVVKGKLAYMPPEQLEARPVDARTDIYSLAAVGYQLLSGYRPFPGGTDGEIIAQVLSRAPTPLPNDLPRGLVRLIMGSLEKDPRGRAPSAAAFAASLTREVAPCSPEALAAFLSQVVPSEDPLRRRFRRAARRRPSTRAMRLGGAIPAPVQGGAAPWRGARSLLGALVGLVVLGYLGAWLARSVLPSQEQPRPLLAPAPVAAPAPPVAAPAAALPAAAALRAPPAPEGPEPARHDRPPAARKPPLAMPAPHRAAPQLGSLEVLSDVPCEVTIDGRAAGTAISRVPATRSALAFGKHLVRCRSGQVGLDVERQVSVGGEETARVHFAPARATLRVRVAPWGSVRVDGRDLGLTPVPPLETYEGRHRVEGMQGAHHQVREVILRPGEDKLVIIPLGPPE